MSRNSFARFGSIALLVIVAAVFSFVITRSAAQQAGARITRAIDNSQRFTIRGSRPPRISAATDMGRMNSGTALHGVTLEFSRSAAQEADLKNLIAEQQNPASPLYHKWLTPDQFAARFGLGASDLAKVEGWLQQQGFTIDSVARGRTRIAFSGTTGQIERAFGTEMHSFRVGSENHFAPASDVSIPAALAGVVMNVGHLTDLLKPKPRVRMARPNFTSSQTGNHFLTPRDVAVIYDICNSLINSVSTCSTSYDGTGQSIAVVGQSAVSLADIENFQKALGIPMKDPELVLVPNTGASTVNSGDESESDLDLEYSSSIATGATVYFVYVGPGSLNGVWDSITYAVDKDIAPIISISYGLCEPALGSTSIMSLESVMQQASLQGQTVVGPAGDTGSTDCYGVTPLPAGTTPQELAVDYPASSAYVTAMGGSEFSTADVQAGSAYWTPATSGDVIGSALSYMPNEGVWNDDSSSNSSNPLSSGGGGVSAFIGHQSWQNTNVPGISTAMANGNRMVPDLSLSASPVNAAYLFCSEDSGFTGVTGSCSNGFRDSNNKNLTPAGGTSFDAPIFAGLVALINQKEKSVGQGALNQTIYNLASGPNAYTTPLFHDITDTLGNKCNAGTNFCSAAGSSAYAAATGYDEASGLGSIDFNNLLNAWPAGSALPASSIALSAATAMPAIGATDVITINVSVTDANPLSGTLSMWVDGTAVSPAPTLSGGSATYDFVPGSTGSHVITATYSNDSNHAPSTGTVVVGNGSFRLAATSPPIAAGTSGAATITITPQNSYTGTISWTASSSSTATNICFSLPNATVSSNVPVTATMTIQTTASACAGASVVPSTGRAAGRGGLASLNSGALSRRRSGLLTLAMGLLVAGVFAWRPRKLYSVIGLFVLAVVSLAGLGCGGGSSSVVPISQNKATKGTYTITVTGTDTVTSTIAASTSFTLTID